MRYKIDVKSMGAATPKHQTPRSSPTAFHSARCHPDLTQAFRASPLSAHHVPSRLGSCSVPLLIDCRARGFGSPPARARALMYKPLLAPSAAGAKLRMESSGSRENGSTHGGRVGWTDTAATALRAWTWMMPSRVGLFPQMLYCNLSTVRNPYGSMMGLDPWVLLGWLALFRSLSGFSEWDEIYYFLSYIGVGGRAIGLVGDEVKTTEGTRINKCLHTYGSGGSRLLTCRLPPHT